MPTPTPVPPRSPDDATVPGRITGLSDLLSPYGARTWVEARANPTDPRLPGAALALPARYEDLGPIGEGGMGQVRRVRDRALDRVLAMKIIRSSLALRAGALRRFVEEARITAGIQHPGIVPLHDLGRLDDGRLYFTMREVQGRTLTDVLQEVHAASSPDRWEAAPSGWTFRRLMAAFHGVCETVAFAHRHGVLHRDLKPTNVMVGDYGEVLVLDWGVARLVEREENAESDAAEPDGESAEPPPRGGPRTVVGGVVGTPAYMSPEQARGDAEIDVRADVFLLGGILEELLTGRLPGRGKPGPAAPEDLVAAARRARAPAPEDRFPDVAALADEVGAWLDGARQRERGLALVESASERAAAAERLRDDARGERARAEALLASVPPWAPEAEKHAGWAAAAAADALEREADLADLSADHLLHAALTQVADLPEAHAALGERHRSRHAAAEAQRDAGAAAREETLTRLHADALPADHPERRRLDAWLQGEGALSFRTAPAGALVRLYAYAPEHRRLALRPAGELGRTPLDAVVLPHGSWLLEVEAEGRATVRYPVRIERGEEWTGAPVGRVPVAVDLPPAGALGPDDRYVPGGPFLAGGDPAAPLSLAGRRVWVDGFVARRFPVTHAEFITFLDALVAAGREAEALTLAPRVRGTGSEPGGLYYGRDTHGRFFLKPDAEGDVWHPRWPVMMITWFAAREYARWYAAHTGLPWRLPTEYEWEKAARGVDGRAWPWGDAFDPTWCRMRDSTPGRPVPAPVDDYPVDESPYGVRGLAGNVRDWVADEWRTDGVPLDDAGRPVPDAPGGDPLFRMRRGGTYTGGSGDGRVAFRTRAPPESRDFQVGFRLVRSWPDPSPGSADPSGTTD